MKTTFRRAVAIVAGTVAVVGLLAPTTAAQAATTTVTITPAAKAITYGDADPQFTYSVTGLSGGDTLTTQPTCTVVGAHRNSGVYAITCSGAAANPSKYTIRYATNYLYVYKAALYVYGNYAYRYYGYDDPKLTYTVTGLKYSDTLLTQPTCTVPADHRDVGKYTITCSGADAGPNYQLAYPVNSTTTILQVFPAPLYVYGNYAQKYYGASDPTLTYGVQGLRYDDTLTTAPTCAVPAQHRDAGDYPITCSGADAGTNYAVSYITNAATVLRVLPAPLYVYGNAAVKYYGDPDPKITYTVAGLKNGDQLVTEPTCTLPDDHRDAGDYPITCSGADAGKNYTIGYVTNSVTVLRVAPAPLYIAGNFVQKTYGADDPTLTYTVVGLRNGDTLTTKPTCTVAAEHTDAGDYPITCSGADAGKNYVITYVQNNATVLRVLPARLYVGGTFVQAYYGYGDPKLGYTALGFRNGDTFVTEPTCQVPADHRDAGDYTITCSGADAGKNYVITYVENAATVLRVLPAPLFIAPVDKAKYYGSPDPTFTYVTLGLRYQDTLLTPPTCGVDGDHAAAGSYEITCSGADAGKNYTITYRKGVLYVAPTTTRLTVQPVLIRTGPLGLPVLSNGKLTARLVAAIPYPTLNPLPGQRVTFTSGSTTLCTATTDDNGDASCYPGLQTVQLLLGGGVFTATYAGTPDIGGTSATGGLLRA